jgi:hypothetical protein
MKYRVVFYDPEDATRERPVQMLTNSFLQAAKWRDEMLAKAPRDTCFVEIFITTETMVETAGKRISFSERNPKPEDTSDAAPKTPR